MSMGQIHDGRWFGCAVLLPEKVVGDLDLLADPNEGNPDRTARAIERLALDGLVPIE